MSVNMDMNIAADYQNITKKAKDELKRIEDRAVSKAETLDDIKGDTTGKSFRTADLEKLMEKYDPEAYAQYSKIATGANGARTQSGLAFLSRWMDSVKKGVKNESANSTSEISKANESKLSSKAQDFLKNLRKQYGKYDFFVGNSTDDLKTLVKSGTKEFSVVFSNEELERMAEDGEYAKEKLQSMEHAVKMSEKINQKFGFGQGNSEITKIGMVFHEDGTTSFFAELEKSSANQRERLEKSREEKRADRKEQEKETKKEMLSYAKNSKDTKRTSVQADSMEELMEKIASVEWDAVKSEKKPEYGEKFDFSI
ncbi:MAG: DUF6033 family protein [Clostridium sp.]|nr:DUF6033 family protein [Clostridium sp.]